MRRRGHLFVDEVNAERLRAVGPDVWAEEHPEYGNISGYGGLALVGDRAGVPRADLLREHVDRLTRATASRRWVPVGGALVETEADLHLRIVHWFAVPKAIFDGTAEELARARLLKAFTPTRRLSRVQYKAAPDARLFRYYKSRVSELDERDEVLGTTAAADRAGVRPNPRDKRGLKGPISVLVDSPAQGVSQLSAWNEELHGSPAGTYTACTHALGASGWWGGPFSFSWVPLDVYEALLEAAPERSSVVLTDKGAYGETACPHSHSERGSTRPHDRARPVDVRWLDRVTR